MALGDDPRRDFEAQAQKFLPAMQAMLFRHVRSHHDREDILQEALESAFVGFARAKPRDPRKWLLGVLRHKIEDYYRARSRAARHAEAFEQELADRAASTPAASAEAIETASAVLDAIGWLGGTYQEALYLRLILELSTAEIAEQLGVREGTVRVRLNRGLGRLAELLRKRGYAP